LARLISAIPIPMNPLLGISVDPAILSHELFYAVPSSSTMQI
jgi:hypothetical protein